MVNIYQIFGKVLFNHKFDGIINDPLLVLPGNEQDLAYENIFNTYLFYQVCKVHDIVCFGDKSDKALLSFKHFYLKLVSNGVTTQDTNFR